MNSTIWWVWVGGFFQVTPSNFPLFVSFKGILSKFSYVEPNPYYRLFCELGVLCYLTYRNLWRWTSCQCLTICKKLVFYLLKVYSFPKNYFNFWNILKKWHWFWPPPPPIKMSFLFTHSKFDFFLRPPPLFAQCHSFYWFFFLKSSLSLSDFVS